MAHLLFREVPFEFGVPDSFASGGEGKNENGEECCQEPALTIHEETQPFSFSLLLSRFDDRCLSLFRWINRPPLGGCLRDPAFQMPPLPVFKNAY